MTSVCTGRTGDSGRETTCLESGRRVVSGARVDADFDARLHLAAPEPEQQTKSNRPTRAMTLRGFIRCAQCRPLTPSTLLPR